jgi:hypothetical protein
MARAPNRSKSQASSTDSAHAKSRARPGNSRKDADTGVVPPAAAERSRPAASPDAAPVSPGEINPNLQDRINMEQTASSPPATSTAAAGDLQAQAAPAPSGKKRFDIFIADIGWHTPIAESLRKNLDHCLRYQANSTAYVLNKDQCEKLFRMHPSMIGTEPSVIVIDREACAARRKQGFGFKLNLGLVRDAPTANNLLKWVMAVLAEQKPGSDVTEPIRTVIHKEGLRGAVDILADITRSPFGETATH